MLQGSKNLMHMKVEQVAEYLDTTRNRDHCTYLLLMGPLAKRYCCSNLQTGNLMYTQCRKALMSYSITPTFTLAVMVV